MVNSIQSLKEQANDLDTEINNMEKKNQSDQFKEFSASRKKDLKDRKESILTNIKTKDE